MEVCLLTPAQQEQMVDLLLALHDHYHPGCALDRSLVRNHLLDNLCGPHSQIRLVTAELGGELLGFAAIYLVYSLVEPESAHQRQCVLVKFRLFIDTLAEQFRFFLVPVFKGIDWGDMPKCALRDVVVVSLPVVVQG